MTVVHLKRLLLAIFLSCFLIRISFSATTDSNFDIRAVVLGDVSLVVQRGLNFGQLDRDEPGRTKTVSPTSSNAAKITALGTPNANIAGNFSSSTITLTCQSGGCAGSPPITVRAFRCGDDVNSNCNGRLSSRGEADITIGATETAPANIKTGNYSGTQTFELDYT